MYIVKIVRETDDYYWLSDEWKEYVRDDFDNNVVLTGNKDYDGVTEAYWWINAKFLVKDFDYANDEEQFIEYGMDEDLVNVLDLENKLHQIWGYLSDGNYSSDDECIYVVAQILHNELPIESGTIRGNMQREWQNVYYIDDGQLNLSVLGDWYFGYVNSIEALEDGDFVFSATISDTELWNLLNEGDKKTNIAKVLDISPDEIQDIIEEES